MRRFAVAILLAAFLAATTVACSSTEGLTGGALFLETCGSCHGASGGGGIGPALGPGSNAATNLSDEQIGNVVRVGPGSMPSFGARLDDEQIASLVAHLRELQGG